MALIKCKECETEISTTAKACPKCGAPPPQSAAEIIVTIIQKTGFGTMVIVVLFFGWVVTTIFPKAKPEQPREISQPLVTTPQQKDDTGSCSDEQRKVAQQMIQLSGRTCATVSFCLGTYPNVRVTCNQNLFAYRIVDRGEGTLVELD